MYRILALIVSLLVIPWNQVSADLEVQFTESAPKDRFMIKNTSGCSLTDVRMHIDLSKSRGKLIFDTTATGAGVDVFQPFEAGDDAIEQLDDKGVKDGDSMLAVGISEIDPGAIVTFTIDVDDTLKNSDLGNIRVAGTEIEGGQVKVVLPAREPIVATFDNSSKATVKMPDCQES